MEATTLPIALSSSGAQYPVRRAPTSAATRAEDATRRSAATPAQAVDTSATERRQQGYQDMHSRAAAAGLARDGIGYRARQAVSAYLGAASAEIDIHRIDTFA